MTRRKLFGGVVLSGLALSLVDTVAASITWATPAAGLTRLSLNENPFGPSPRAVEAIQNALTEIARYAGGDQPAGLRCNTLRNAERIGFQFLSLRQFLCLKLISALFEQQEKALSRQYFTDSAVDRVGGSLANFLCRERIPLRAR